MNTVSTYWHGDGALWRVFWLWGVLGSWVLAALFALDVAVFGITWRVFLTAAVIMSAYTVWVLVSVWRCADNARDELWANAARLMTAAWALNVMLVGGFLFLDLFGARLA